MERNICSIKFISSQNFSIHSNILERLNMAASDDKSYLTTIAIVFAVSITFIAISLRFLARKLHKIPLGADDYLMVVGAVSPRPYYPRMSY